MSMYTHVGIFIGTFQSSHKLTSNNYTEFRRGKILIGIKFAEKKMPTPAPSWHLLIKKREYRRILLK